jgi:hypothetical protein
VIRAETEEEKKRREEQQRLFIEGLERYHQRGIRILIDGHVCQPREYRKLFIREGKSFYMGDYIGDEDGELREIHFDRVYYR